jgi:DNA-binding transcriptional MerR regulator
MQKQKFQMNKRKFRIGDLAKKLKLKKFVIRFWEKEFQLKSDRSTGGQRFYTQEDFDTFILIKELLYTQKFTIPGAKKQLEALEKNKNLTKNITPAVMATEQALDNFTTLEPEMTTTTSVSTGINNARLPEEIAQKLNMLKKQLLELKKVLL